ncbi:MAG: nickel pincer cofactor biosynthesis protein LarC [Thermodesulfobacteriota bacterium]
MGRHLHLDPLSGIAGDMLLAGLVHLGACAQAIEEAVNAVPAPVEARVRLDFEPHRAWSVRGLRLRVALDPPRATDSRSYPELRDALACAPLPASVQARSLAALEALARAEAAVRGLELDQVRFCELGGFDTVVDLVGGCLGLELLGIASASCGPLPLGRGTMPDSPAGASPCPSPAALELLHGLPTVGLDVEHELVTPTGAALARTLSSSFGPPPSMVLLQAGAGFGTAELPGRPNCLRLLLGEETSVQPAREYLRVLEANLDDLSPEILATLPNACLAAGALDAWLTPVIMKKGRPAHLLSALCRPQDEATVGTAIFRHSSTLGVRSIGVERTALERRWEEAQTPWGPVRIKVGTLEGKTVNQAPEFEDCRQISENAGVPLKEVYAAALAGRPGKTHKGV